MRAGLTAVVAVLGLAACGASDVRVVATGPRPVAEGERDPFPVKSTTTIVTTTTTTKPAPRTVTTHASRGGGRTYRGNPAGSYNGYPCGGDLPPCSTLKRESHGSPTAVNRTGCGGRTCGGLWQFDPVTFIPGCTVSKWKKGTCGTYQGFRFGQDAPADVQNERAAEVWDHGRGCGHWAAC